MREGSLRSLNRRLWALMVSAGLAMGWLALVDGQQAALATDDLRSLQTHYQITTTDLDRNGSVLSFRDVWTSADFRTWIEAERSPEGTLLEVTWEKDGVVTWRDAQSDFLVVRSAERSVDMGDLEFPGPPSLVGLGRAVAFGEAQLLRTPGTTRILLEDRRADESVAVVAEVDPGSLIPTMATITRSQGDRVVVTSEAFTVTAGTPVPEDVLAEVNAPAVGSDSYHELTEFGARTAMSEHGLSFPNPEPLAGYGFVKAIVSEFRGLTESQTTILLYDDDGRPDEIGTYNVSVFVTSLEAIRRADGRVDLAVDETRAAVDLGGVWARYDLDGRRIAFDTDLANVTVQFNAEMQGRPDVLADLTWIARQILGDR